MWIQLPSYRHFAEEKRFKFRFVGHFQNQIAGAIIDRPWKMHCTAITGVLQSAADLLITMLASGKHTLI